MVAQDLQTFQVKIGDGNAASIALFNKLGFSELSHSSAFKETTFQWSAEGEHAMLLRQHASPVCITSFANRFMDSAMQGDASSG